MTLAINGNLLGIYTDYVTGAMQALLPLIGAVAGVFLAFAIANQVRHFVIKAAK